MRRLFEHYVEHPEQLPPALDGERTDGERAGDGVSRMVTDYLAGMTDRYCIRRYTELQVPQAFAR